MGGRDGGIVTEYGFKDRLSDWWKSRRYRRAKKVLRVVARKERYDGPIMVTIEGGHMDGDEAVWVASRTVKSGTAWMFGAPTE